MHDITLEGEYQQKEADAVQQLEALISKGQHISIKKNLKHTFKTRVERPNLDLRHFNQVISVDTENQVAAVEGLTTFFDIVDATLRHNLMPQVVPELRSITIGGAIAGLGGQSSSFKHGLVHEMVTDFDLLTGEGKVVHCSPEINSDLFYMLPNSYGSLGYVLRCSIRLNKVSPFVKVQYLRFSRAKAFFEAMTEEVASSKADFLEGVSFSPNEYILLIGSFADTLPPNEKCIVPLYKPFFKSIQDPVTMVNHLSIRNHIWRWDSDAFWATDQKNIIGSILLNPFFRRTFGRFILRSDRLLKIGKYRTRLREKGTAKYLFLEAKRKEGILQDAAIPVKAAGEFDAWLAKELRIYPLWYCPVRTTQPLGKYPLYNPESELVLDFGFYVSMDLGEDLKPYHYTLQIEEKLLQLGGIKCLYSDTFFDQEQFWSIYDKTKYDQVKAKYDPNNTFLDLYSKVVNKS